jgi:hypothetical protein
MPYRGEKPFLQVKGQMPYRGEKFFAHAKVVKNMLCCRYSVISFLEAFFLLLAHFPEDQVDDGSDYCDEAKGIQANNKMYDFHLKQA